MPYSFNPHRHVKIWLSLNPDSFLNAENQLRLVRMRALNPKDEISLVYSEQLLSQQALQALRKFCSLHQISPISYERDVKPNIITQCSFEPKITSYIDKEIQQLSSGGNVAAISDMIRWLSPVYQRGTYSDFDVHINTTGLPATVDVNSPLLLNIGSIKLGDIYESIVLNNDIVAVVNPDEASLKIKLIHTRFVMAYENRFMFDYGTYHNEANHFFKSVLQKQEFDKLTDLKKDMIHIDYLEQLRNNYSPKRTPTEVRAALKAEKKESCDDTYTALLKLSVMATTGPTAIVIGLFFSPIHKSSFIQENIMPMSFNTYHLTKAFLSLNSAETLTKLAEKNTVLSVGEVSDVSWLDIGQNAQRLRENKLDNAAGRIQSFFRHYKQYKNSAPSYSTLGGNLSNASTPPHN